MDTPEKRRQLEVLGEEIFELSKLVSRSRAQAMVANKVETLTETENLTLDLLSRNPVMTVGEIQKAIGVLPAQMSRVVRSLEDKSGTAFIQCRINAQDRRRIDVCITPEGTAAMEAYREARLESILRILSILDESERSEFMRMIRKIREHVFKSIKNK